MALFGRLSRHQFWNPECARFTTSCSSFFSCCRRRIISGGCGGAATGCRVSASGLRKYDAGPQTGADQPPRHLDARRQRRRGQPLHAAHPRARTARAQPQDSSSPRPPPPAWRELRRRLPTHVSKIYYPVDRRKYVNRAMATINPEAIVLVEAEIWPNFLWRAQRLGNPGFSGQCAAVRPFISALQKIRISVPAAVRSRFAGVGCQNEADAARLREVGCRPEAVRVVGNLKFDAAKLDGAPDAGCARRCCGSWACRRMRPILVAGSTHDGEEIILAEMAARLRAQFPKLFLVLVPRHFERCREIGQKLRARGVKFFWRSDIFRQDQPGAGRGRMPAGQHDRRTAIFLRAGDRRVRRQKPDGDGRTESD